MAIPLALDRSALTYAARYLPPRCNPRFRLLIPPSYCEQNIYGLLRQHIPPTDYSAYTVVFISNPEKYAPLFSQLLQTTPHIPVWWDYHVILLYTPPPSSATTSQSQIYDFDTPLPFPCPFVTYTSAVFHGPPSSQYVTEPFISQHPRYFRLVPAASYIRNFESSGENMFKSVVDKNGVEIRKMWSAEPPEYGVIVVEDTLDKYLDFSLKDEEEEGDWGEVVGEKEFLRRFS